MTLEERCATIRLLLLDVDGVLTDGSIIYTDTGAEAKAFHVRDGSGLKLWERAGKKAGIVTGRTSGVVARRAADLDIAIVVQGTSDKAAELRKILNEQNLQAQEVGFIGDDLPDVPIMRACGLAVAVADACVEAKDVAHYVTAAAGGQGAVRETIEVILRAQGLWQRTIAPFCD